ncbi:3-oxoacyl-[acyl-carrier-protein] reductase FabG isoform X1 [Eurytemora carolleeae]|uniref:3-oxoacyl-[acyl-carrier-protein] reductase FabG isoform X1 n=1 Tax=Eurytemora carolleeae TaxID=1294199 RepID=UPI000C75A261|nr:3-oxoacyl-[acyl-carrier-protein] reductase FabG isoform X1 [Eurytemora carolleeae]|eukprot:XP_023329192.1 3-oxoacyl-[acyl-carrier-protein] reductase FabG-like isoform X1 [Eurytemora affinis]
MASGLTLKEQPGLDAEFTKNRFKDQVVVVTGGGGGIGGAIVYRFLQDGAKVAILDLDENNADSKLAEVGDNLGKNARVYKIDVSKREDCFDVVEKIVNDLGTVCHLVNCVAYFGSESLNSTYKDWERTFAVNVMGNAFMTQAVVQYMKNSARKNMSITHISSISAHQAQPNRWTYAASKGAINILTKTMALDLAKWKIRVNSVSPGWIWSPEVAKAANGDREKWEPIWGKFHINGRLGEMSEVAAAVSFLASEDAAFINATDLKVICM